MPVSAWKAFLAKPMLARSRNDRTYIRRRKGSSRRVTFATVPSSNGVAVMPSSFLGTTRDQQAGCGDPELSSARRARRVPFGDVRESWAHAYPAQASGPGYVPGPVRCPLVRTEPPPERSQRDRPPELTV